MESLSNESTPRERLARLITLMKRTRMFWRSASAIAVVGLAVSFGLAWNAKRAWRSETTVGYMDSIRTNKDGESSTSRAARLGPKLKDLVYARPRLAEVIDEFHLFPEKTAKSMIEAEDEMQGAIGFHARQSDTFVVSFTYEDPVVAQKVAARLADNMIDDYNKENLTGATLTRDFLNKKRAEASRRVDDASRGLAEFLALHPQFQWGLNDSPYAATAAVPGPRPPVIAPRPRPRATDATMARLEGALAHVDAELAPPSAPLPPVAVTTGEAQKQRDAAAAALAQAEAALAEKLTVVTPAHPDAVAAQAKVNAARAAFATADAALHQKTAPTVAPSDDKEIEPEVRARLERERSQIRGQMAERRKELSEGATDAPAASTSVAADKAPAQDIVDLETEWHRLKLDLDRARDELHNVELTAQAADISADAMEKKSQSEMRILDPAYRPTKPDKGKGRVFLIGAVIALFIALGYAGARVLLNDTLLDAGDVVALGGPQPLVEVPLLARAKPLGEREMSPRANPEVVTVPGEQADEPAVATPVVVTAPPVSETVRQLPASRNLRKRQATMRWGTRLPADGGAVAIDAYAIDVEAEPVPQRASLAVVPSPILAVGGGPEPPPRKPVVQVIGVDLDPHGPGAFGLLHGATPELLAALRVLRHRLDQRRAGAPCVVAVVSPGADEGKSALAARLAMTLGESDRARVVLVEGNLERPRVAKTLGIALPPEAGLSQQVHERMRGSTAPWGVVKLGPSLSTLAEPEIAAYPGVVHATHFIDAIRALKARYDYVVLDGPSVLGSGDANVLEEVSDVVLVVARAAKTKASALAQAERQLGEAKILGVVLNGVARPRPKAARARPS